MSTRPSKNVKARGEKIVVLGFDFG